MKKLLLFGIILSALPLLSKAQCTTTNATSCVCASAGSTNCDLLPDIIVGRPPLLVSGNNGIIEYSQTGNGVENGRLRISVSSPNIGHGPLEIRTTNTYVCGTDTIVGTAPATCPNTGLPPKQLIVQRVYHKNGATMSYLDRDAGTMTYHPTHGHMHVDNWGVYTLRTQTNDPNPLNWPIIGTGAKLAFCLMDYGSCSTYNGHCVDSTGATLLNGNFPNYGLGGGAYNCSPTVQGISSGYTDIYYQYLDGMYITIPPGVCNGQYYIVVQLDPLGYFLEENENNNVIVVPYTLVNQSGTVPVISVNGSTSLCPGQSTTLTCSPAPSYLWSTGATTQSITVTQPGNYTVTTDVGTSCPGTSLPQTITVQNMPVTITPTAASVCPGQSSTLNTTVTTPPTGTVQTGFTNNTVYAIPDNNTTGVTSSIVVSGISPATLASGSIFSVQVNITHTYDGDLNIFLIAPSGNNIYLSNSRGGSGDNFNNTIFSMTAATPIASGNAPFNGSYIPDGSFNTLTGNVNGTWQLRVVDHAGVDIGNLNSWTITFNNVVTAQVGYSWSSVPSGFSSTAANPVVTPAQTTTYTVIATNLVTGCSGTQTTTITVNPTPVITVTGTNSICAGSTTSLTASGAATYTWSPGTGLNTTNGASVLANPPATTTYTITGTSAAGCSATQTVTVTVNPLPVVTLSAFSAVCNNAAAFTLTGGSPSGGTYSGPGVSAGAFTPATAGVGTHTITYNYTNGNGCSGTATNTLTVNNCNCTVPGAPTNLQGVSRPCPGSTYTYSVANNAAVSTYTWTPPANASVISGQGTNTVQIAFASAFTSGSICVTGTNACGTSPARCKTVSRNSATTPAAVLGNLGGQCQSTVTLSIAPVTNAISYNWTLPAGTTYISGQGTTSITFSTNPGFVSGSVCVNSYNGCLTSTNRCATLYATPAKPVITGPSTACVNQQGVAYSVAPVFGATNYVWAAPSGSSVASGQGSTAATINFGSTAGNVSCQAWNACGKRGTTTKAITFNCRMAATIDAELFPNPATDIVNIVIHADRAGNSEIQLMDLTGRVLEQHEFNITEGENTIELNVQPYSEGVYLINVVREGVVSRMKFVIE